LLPPSACQTIDVVSFRSDVRPLLETHCLHCHKPPAGAGYRAAGLSMETYESLMQGTVYGPVAIPGDSRHSPLTMLVEGRADASVRMPHRPEKPLQPEDIEILRRWIDRGARNN
jgi:hypothetical protein